MVVAIVVIFAVVVVAALIVAIVIVVLLFVIFVTHPFHWSLSFCSSFTSGWSEIEMDVPILLFDFKVHKT